MTPVLLLTGFLGSGKTTLLQRLLTDPAMARAAVLINEFGEVALDHHLLDRIDDAVVVLKSGCICCSVRGEVAEALQNLHSLRAQGKVEFDRVVIETTGLADPFPVLSTLRAHPVLRSHFSAGGVLVTVDAVNAERQMDRRAEALRQIAAADTIVLTKTDLANPATTFALRSRLSALNPQARVVDGQAVALADLLQIDAARFWQAGPMPDCGCAAPHDPATPCGGLHHHHDTGFGVQTLSLVIDGQVDWTAFGIWLTMLLNRHGNRIYRVKGILNLAGEPRPVAIHGVQHLVHPPVHLGDWPDDDRRSRLVFIMEGIEPDLLRRSFDAFNALDRGGRVALAAE